VVETSDNVDFNQASSGSVTCDGGFGEAHFKYVDERNGDEIEQVVMAV
jgi:hypothetical protein